MLYCLEIARGRAQNLQQNSPVQSDDEHAIMKNKATTPFHFHASVAGH